MRQLLLWDCLTYKDGKLFARLWEGPGGLREVTLKAALTSQREVPKLFTI